MTQSTRHPLATQPVSTPGNLAPASKSDTDDPEHGKWSKLSHKEIGSMQAAKCSNFSVESENENHMGPKYCEGLLTKNKVFSFQRPELLLYEDKGKNLYRSAVIWGSGSKGMIDVQFKLTANKSCCTYASKLLPGKSVWLPICKFLHY